MNCPSVMVVALVYLLGSSRVGAQSTCTNTNVGASASCTRNLTFTRTVGTVIKFDEGTLTVTLGAPTSTDFDAGYVQSAGPTVTVYSNSAWTLKLDSPASTWTGTATTSEPVRASKPVGDLRWSTTANGIYTALLTNSGVSVATGSATNGTPITLFFRTALNWTLDTPGNYTLSVRFTLTSP